MLKGERDREGSGKKGFSTFYISRSSLNSDTDKWNQMDPSDQGPFGSICLLGLSEYRLVRVNFGPLKKQRKVPEIHVENRLPGTHPELRTAPLSNS